MNLNNPSHNRIVGYLIMISGAITFGIGMEIAHMNGIIRLLGEIVCIIGVALFIASTVWMYKKVRCPHCGMLLHFKFYSIRKYPHCGKRTDDV